MNFKNTIEFLSLNYKKEITKIILLAVLLLVVNTIIFIFAPQIFVFVLSLVFSIIFLYLYVSRYSSMKDKIYLERENEFLKIISYFKIFITNNFNVYQAFEALLPYCSTWLKEKVEELLINIDEDKSVQPFIDFAKLFNNLLIENVLLSIYQMIEEGENSNNLNRFSLLFDDIERANQEALEEKKIKSLDSMNAFPLIGAGYITIVLVFGVFTILGDLINVL